MQDHWRLRLRSLFRLGQRVSNSTAANGPKCGQSWFKCSFHGLIEHNWLDLQQLPACVKAQSQLHQQGLEASTLIQQLITRQAERFRIQPERTTFTRSVGGTLIFVELAALEGPDLQNSTVTGQNLGVGFFSAPKTSHRRHAYCCMAGVGCVSSG